jgi:hypothetical protein
LTEGLCYKFSREIGSEDAKSVGLYKDRSFVVAYSDVLRKKKEMLEELNNYGQ